MANDNPQLRLDNQLCFALYFASRQMTQIYRKHLDPLGLTYPQYLVLMVLWETPCINMKDIGKRLGLDSGTLTPLLKRMEKQGLLSRTRNQANEREIIVELQGKGSAIEQQVIKLPDEMKCHIALPESELFSLKNVLKKLNQKLNHSLCSE